jgi:hypothetical protein
VRPLFADWLLRKRASLFSDFSMRSKVTRRWRLIKVKFQLVTASASMHAEDARVVFAVAMKFYLVAEEEGFEPPRAFRL